MQILVPIAGSSPFFPADEYYFPKPLVEVAGQPMIALVIQYLRRDFPDAEFVFVVGRDDMRSFSLDRVVELAAGPESRVVERLADTSGALCSCLLAVDALDPERPLLIANSDQIITENLASHISRLTDGGADAGVVTFNSVHPRWSYVVEGDGAEIVQAFEKRVVSRNAIAGLYYFRQAGLFLEAAQKAILNDANVNGAFFISASLNEAILLGSRVLHSSIAADDYHSFYAPARITAFERSSAARGGKPEAQAAVSINIVIPAAGEGSRFARAGWKKPKPFIDVNGAPMLSHVIRNVVPAGADATLLLRREHIEAQADSVLGFEREGVQIVPVAGVTEGTACTVLLARKHFDGDAPMMVANSDQLVDFDVSDFIDDCLSRRLDGSILVFRDPEMDPKWSFARLGPDGLVAEVAEKKAISDLATVGIYLFARGRDFVAAAADMIAMNERVNGEFYTCPVYNYMIASGARIGVFEVGTDATHGLGTPEDLDAFLDRTGAPRSADRPD